MKLKELLKTINFWLFFFIGLTVILGIITNITNSQILYTMTFVAFAPVAVYIVVGVLFTWIINPIRLLIYKIKNKK